MAERCKRCSIEHRTIRKELSKWHKNVALLVGMERVAQELMGGRKWRKLMNPLNSLEKTEPEDWSQTETCYLCNTKTQSSYDSIDSVVPPCDELLDEKTSNNNFGDQCSLCAGLSTPNSNSKCSCKSSQPHSPHPYDQPLDLSTHSRHKGSAKAVPHSEDASQMSDKKKKPIIKVPQPTTTTKAIKRNRLPTNTTWKRTYTEEELQAALRDIQSGKLGTRRAAVIYGIPRSTLRNKVYKLALDKSSNGKRKVSPTPTPTANTSTSAYTPSKKLSKTSLLNHNNTNKKSPNSVNSTLDHMPDDPNSSTSASESLKQILKNAITQRANAGSSSSSATSAKPKSNQSSVGSVGLGPALMGSLSGLSGAGLNSLTDLYNCEALATIQMLSTIECGQALAPLFTQFLLNIHQLTMAKCQSQDNCEDTANSMATSNLPILPDLIRKLAEDQMVQTARTNWSQSSNQSNGDKSESQPEMSGNCNNNVILKVPSYRPKTSSAATSDPKLVDEEQPNDTTSDTEPVNQLCTSSSHIESDERINDEFESKSFSLNDIIAKSISQRLYSSTTSAKFSNVANSEDSSSDALASDDKYDKYDGLSGSDRKNSGNVSDHSNPSTPEKRNRPKRGRYRNYNRDDLAKAVKAVQRGEMSVHRAGTLFGVPHSTLEYKVKERHLLRPKKRSNESTVSTKKESLNKPNGNLTNPVVNGSSGIVVKEEVDGEAKSGPSLPLWTGLPLFAVDVNNVGNSANFFASNMMRKLQENARMNEEVIKTQTDPNLEYGGLLLESLIKSSLVNNSNSKRKAEDVAKDNDNDNEVVNTSLELLKEVSALGRKD